MKSFLAALLLAAGLFIPCAAAQQSYVSRKIFEENKAVAEQGNAAAQWYVGFCYYQGSLGPKEA